MFEFIKKPELKVAGVLLAICAIGLTANSILLQKSYRQEYVHVQDKERVMYIAEGRTRYKYVVYTENQVFELKDMISVGKFNTLDTYNRLKVGYHCHVVTAGWRIPSLNMKKNILKVNECHKRKVD